MNQKNYNELGFTDLQDAYGGSIIDMISLSEDHLYVEISYNTFENMYFIGNDTSLIYLISDGEYIIKNNVFTNLGKASTEMVSIKRAQNE